MLTFEKSKAKQSTSLCYAIDKNGVRCGRFSNFTASGKSFFKGSGWMDAEQLREAAAKLDELNAKEEGADTTYEN